VSRRRRSAKRAAVDGARVKEDAVIYVSKEQLDSVEYLLHQSVQGNHVLFDPETIRAVLTSPECDLSEPEAYSVEHHIERLIMQPTLMQKRAYLEKLDPETYRRVVRTYFNIVENSLYENLEVRH
jgi:hypothetical protein